MSPAPTRYSRRKITHVHAPETMRTMRSISGDIGCGAAAAGVTFCTVQRSACIFPEWYTVYSDILSIAFRVSLSFCIKYSTKVELFQSGKGERDEKKIYN